MHKIQMLLSSFVVSGVAIGASPAWPQTPELSHSSAHAEDQGMAATPHKKHKHHNRNFYGKHYDPWAHSKGSH